MSHGYHEGLPGYDERQIWFDGCAECESRGANVPQSIGTLDNETLDRALVRALAWNKDSAMAWPVSQAELPLLRFLDAAYRVMQRLERMP